MNVKGTSYQIIYDIEVDENHYIYAEDTSQSKPYFVGNYYNDELTDVYENGLVTNDYIDAMLEWLKRLNYAFTQKKNEYINQKPLEVNDCSNINFTKDIINKIVVINAVYLKAQARYSACQLMKIDRYDAEKRYVFCTRVYDGKKYQIPMDSILGEVKKQSIPEWAKEKLEKQGDAEYNVAKKQQYSP